MFGFDGSEFNVQDFAKGILLPDLDVGNKVGVPPSKFRLADRASFWLLVVRLGTGHLPARALCLGLVAVHATRVQGVLLLVLLALSEWWLNHCVQSGNNELIQGLLTGLVKGVQVEQPFPVRLAATKCIGQFRAHLQLCILKLCLLLAGTLCSPSLQLAPKDVMIKVIEPCLVRPLSVLSVSSRFLVSPFVVAPRWMPPSAAGDVRASVQGRGRDPARHPHVLHEGRRALARGRVSISGHLRFTQPLCHAQLTSAAEPRLSPLLLSVWGKYARTPPDVPLPESPCSAGLSHRAGWFALAVAEDDFAVEGVLDIMKAMIESPKCMEGVQQRVLPTVIGLLSESAIRVSLSRGLLALIELRS